MDSVPEQILRLTFVLKLNTIYILIPWVHVATTLKPHGKR